MMRLLTGRLCLRFAGVALFAFVVLAAGCGRPPESWLRFLGFSDGSSLSSSTVTLFEGNLRDGKAMTANAILENRSLNADQKVGTGIVVYRARVEYRMAGFSPPTEEYPVNLYLSPPGAGTATTGTLTDFPVVSAALKSWLIDNAADPSFVNLTARVTFFGETDEGARLETEGSVGIALSN